MVKNIILVDNDPLNLPKNFDLGLFEKIIYLPQKENIYVNPSWNLGAKYSNEDVLAFCNDDINFDVSFFNFLEIPRYSLIGMHEMNYRIQENYNLRYFPTEKITYGFGCLMLINRSDFVEIPEKLKIYYGDNFLMSKAKDTYSVFGLSIKTEMSTSSKVYENSNFDEMDRLFFEKYLQNTYKSIN